MSSACGIDSRWTTGAWRVSRFELGGHYEYPVHSHERDGLVVMLLGALDIDMGRTTVSLAEGEMWPLRRELPHQEWPAGGTARCLLIEETRAQQLGLAESCAPPRALAATELDALSAVTDALASRSPTARTASGRALGELLRTRRGAGAMGTERGWLLAAWTRLERGFRSPQCRSALAEEVGVSREHLSREFHRTFGASMTSYVMHRRLEYAAERLRAGDSAIASIAYQAGFSDQSHLTRRFRSHFGTTPARYRRLNRSAELP